MAQNYEAEHDKAFKTARAEDIELGVIYMRLHYAEVQRVANEIARRPKGVSRSSAFNDIQRAHPETLLASARSKLAMQRKLRATPEAQVAQALTGVLHETMQVNLFVTAAQAAASRNFSGEVESISDTLRRAEAHAHELLKLIDAAAGIAEAARIQAYETAR